MPQSSCPCHGGKKKKKRKKTINGRIRRHRSIAMGSLGRSLALLLVATAAGPRTPLSAVAGDAGGQIMVRAGRSRTGSLASKYCVSLACVYESHAVAGHRPWVWHVVLVGGLKQFI